MYIKKLLFFLIIIPLVYMLYAILFYKEYKNTYTYKLYVDKKVNYANKFNTKRIFVSGGSSVRYGVKTESIEKELKIPSINMALNMAFEADYMFHMLKKIVKKNDIVIIPMEYEIILLEKHNFAMRKQYILTYDKEYLFSLPILDILDIVYSITPEDIIRSLKDSLFLSENLYNEQKKFINKNGDQVNNIGMEFDDSGERFKVNNKPLKEYLGLQDIIKFNEYCKKYGIIFYMTFPNIMYDEKLYTQDYINFYKNLTDFYKKNNINYIDYPTNTIFKKPLFYNSAYHLNQKGMEIRTKKLIELIRKDILKIPYKK